MRFLITTILLSPIFCFSQFKRDTCFINMQQAQLAPSIGQVVYPVLNSYPQSNKCILLDFDGHIVTGTRWNLDDNGVTVLWDTIHCEPSGLTEPQIQEVFEKVSEDYSIFKLNITTDTVAFNNAPHDGRMRVVITPTYYFFPNASGVAWSKSFTFGDQWGEEPCFVFSSKLNYESRNVWETCSHESGHTLGLDHQAWFDNNCNLISPYSLGFGLNYPVSDIGWSPIMGNSRYNSQTTWANGATQYGCNVIQDNIEVIKVLNGLELREKSTPVFYVDTLRQVLLPFGKDTVYLNVPTQSFIQFSCITGGNTDLNVNISGADFQNPDSLSVRGITILQPGTHRIEISGYDNQNCPDYGNGGGYTLVVKQTPTGVVGIEDNTVLPPIRTPKPLRWKIFNTVGQELRSGIGDIKYSDLFYGIINIIRYENGKVKLINKL